MATILEQLINQVEKISLKNYIPFVNLVTKIIDNKQR